MKNLHIFWIALLALAITVATAQGQPQQDRGERVEALKVSFITEQLSLTPDEARVFWPVFNQFEAERKAIRQEYKGGGQKLEFMNDAEAEAMINKEIAFQQKNLDVTKKYIGEFKEILPVKKVAVLLTLEKKFSKMLLEKVKQGGGPPR